MRVSFMCGQLL